MTRKILPIVDTRAPNTPQMNPTLSQYTSNERLKVALINMEGEKDPSLHEPISIEVLASRILGEFHNAEIMLYDTQPELVRFGKIDTTKLTEMICQFGNDNSIPLLLGISVPIYSYSYTKSLLLKLESSMPLSPTSIVLGNAIPTYTEPNLILNDFPSVTLVRGEGDEVILEIARNVANYISLEKVYEQKPDMNAYSIPYREGIVQGVMAFGGSIKVETSRGCDYGSCTFCSRCERGGKDYRTIPEDKVVETITELISKYNVPRFELTDEEAFADVHSTHLLIHAIKDAGLPRVPFSASLRVDLLVNLEEQGLLSPLIEVGLSKVFLGVEGGSNPYLKLMAKGTTVEESRKAIAIAKSKHLDYEIGFIMFSWRMTLEMLRDNIAFVSEGDNVLHISSLFNKLEVRAGTADEIHFLRGVKRGRFHSDTGFSINDSTYKNAPFLDKQVAYIYNSIEKYEAAEANLYYSMKSYLRSGMADAATAEKVGIFYRGLIDLRVRLLKVTSGLENGTVEEIVNERHKLISGLNEALKDHAASGALELVRREAKIFLIEDPERTAPYTTHIGSMIIARAPDGKVLLARPRLEDKWAFVGGGVKEGESFIDAAIREAGEELGKGIKFTNLSNVGIYVDNNHLNSQSLSNERLELHHFTASVNGNINLLNADHEIADILWAEPKDILSGRIVVRPNVLHIMHSLYPSGRSIQTYQNLLRE